MSTDRDRNRDGTFAGDNGVKYKQKIVGVKLPFEADQILREKEKNLSGYAREAILTKMRNDGYIN